MVIEQGSKYAGLQPLERFRVFRQGYDSLVPTQEMRNHTVAYKLWLDNVFPKAQVGKSMLEVLNEHYTPENQIRVDSLKRREEGLETVVNQQEQELVTSQGRQLLLADMHELLYSAPVRHTDEFYGVVLGVLDEKYIHRWRNQKRFTELTDEAILTDPYRVGGLFHPAFGQGIESVVYSYYHRSVKEPKCVELLLEELDDKTFASFRNKFNLPEGTGRPGVPRYVHDEAKCQLEREAQRSMVVNWREHFIEIFGQEPYTEVSYNLKSWKDDYRRRVRRKM